jgi:hypothetical protein
VVIFCDRIYWALSTHWETPSLALQTNRDDSRGGTVAEADEVCQEPFPETLVAVFGVCSCKSSASMVTCWGRGRSNGTLRLDGAPYHLSQTFRDLNPVSMRAQLQH